MAQCYLGGDWTTQYKQACILELLSALKLRVTIYRKYTWAKRTSLVQVIPFLFRIFSFLFFRQRSSILLFSSITAVCLVGIRIIKASFIFKALRHKLTPIEAFPL